jgi:hypothetical protein
MMASTGGTFAGGELRHRTRADIHEVEDPDASTIIGQAKTNLLSPAAMCCLANLPR